MKLSMMMKGVAKVFPALSHRNYRLFWFGQCVSLIGTWMQNIGQSWLVLQLTGSPLKLGIVSAIQFLPMMLFSLYAGTLVDRLPKRKVLLFTQSGLMVLAAILATLTYFKVVQYWHVLLLALMLGIINTLDMPTRQSFFIELVGKEDLMNAIALNSTIFNLARVVGPAIAGFLIGLLGIAVCFYLNALSFVAVIAGIWLINVPSQVTPLKGGNILGNISEGLRYTMRKPIIYLPLALLAVISTFAMNFNVLIPVFAKQNLGQNAMGFGLLMTSMGIGSMAGALTLAARSRVGPRMGVMFAGALGLSAFILVLGLVKVYVIACVLLLITGFCSITFTASVNTTIQLNSEDYIRGRVMSLYSLVFGGVIPIGSLFAGKIAETVGAPVSLAVSGVIGVAAAIITGSVYYKKRGMEEGAHDR